jgi:hypothetical protein
MLYHLDSCRNFLQVRAAAVLPAWPGGLAGAAATGYPATA